MKHPLLSTPKQYVDIGDRIIIRPRRQAMANLAGKLGTVVEVFDAPRGSCMVRLEAGHNLREQFLYGDEIDSDHRR